MYTSVHKYISGRCVSRSVSIILLFLVLKYIVRILMLQIYAYVDLTITQVIDTNAIISLSTEYTFGMTYILLAMQGFLDRNMVQIILATLVAFFISSIFMWRSLISSLGFYKYLFFSVNIFTTATDIMVLWVLYYCRKEFGWFYYKSYGANIALNTRYTIRKTLEIFYKLMLQFFICFWIPRFTIHENASLLAIELSAYALTIFLYVAEGVRERMVFRVLNIAVNIAIITSLVIQTAGGVSFNNIVQSPTVKFNSSFWDIYVYAGLAIQSIYAILLFVDLFSFGYGLDRNYSGRQNIRISIIDEAEKP